MSEVKRTPTQSLELTNSLSNATKKEKKEKGKQLAPSFRFELSLGDKNEKGYFEFNYTNLLKNAEKKKLKEFKNVDENALNGQNPFNDDDDSKLKEIAKRFEAKYGTTHATGKNKKKYDDDVDLGAGYDENDSFIDNTDAYDEVVPEGVTTAHGGFYINSGPLEFSVKENNQNSIIRNNINDEESSESSDDDDEDSPDSKRRDRDSHNLSSTDEDDTDEVNTRPLSKKSKLDDNCEKKSIYDNVAKKKKRNDQLPGDSLTRQKPENMEVDNFIENQDEKKKLHCDPSRSKDKKLIKKSITNGIDDKRNDLKKGLGKDNNIDDAIESVVNDGKIDDESSRDTEDSGKSRCIAGTSSECEDTDKVDVRLPDHLPEDLKEIIIKLNKHAENSKEGKIKFFDSFVNETLLSLEKKLRVMNSSTIRSQVYGHLAHRLSCSKITLVNRAKKLCLQDAEIRIKEPVQRLKAIIDRVMATQKDEEECRKLSDDKGTEGSLSDGYSSDGNKKTEKSKLPRKRFPWTNEAKKLVVEIVNVWRQYYKIRRPRKESMPSFIASMMESKLLPLWPKGWMRIEILMAFSNSESIVKRKQKKSRDTTVPNELSSITTNNCAIKVDMANVNQKLSSETIKSPSHYDQDISANNTTTTTAATTMQNMKTSTLEITIEKKSSNKYKDKIKDNSSIINQCEVNSSITPVAKISLVPTSQLMAQKPIKNHTDKFDPIDLTSNSLSITPVNDYQKLNKITEEVKKDIISITAFPESSTNITVINDGGSHSSSYRQDVKSYSIPHLSSSSSTTGSSKPVSLKQRILQESVNIKIDKRLDDRDNDNYLCDQKDKKRDRWIDDNKLKSSYDVKKKRKDKLIESSQPNIFGVLNVLQSSSSASSITTSATTALSKEEQEKRQIEETMAATNYLSQIINDDAPRLNNDKRKELNDDGINNLIQPSEQEKDVQMVMRSLKELQELQEMKFSPNHSPLQKPMSTHQYIGYNEDYHRHYQKKDDKMRNNKDESQW